MRNLEIAVLGAGVVGVNTALKVQEEFASAKITLIDDKFDETTLSYGPPGVFFPSSDFGGLSVDCASERTPGSITQTSYNFYQQLLGVPNSGITSLSGYIFSDTSEDHVKNDLLVGILPCYRSATKDERNLHSKTRKYGSYIETIRTQCTLFIPWALNKFKQQRGFLKKKNIENFTELENNYDVVFNCTGLKAKYLCNDQHLVPIRGQTLKVYAPEIKNLYFYDHITYIFPLGDGIVCLGGRRDYDSYNLNVDQFDTQSIIQRCSDIVPSLKNAKILSQWVGLRPHRNIIRLETENLGKLKVVHNYGHGSSGITTAPGTADYVVKLFKNSHSSKSKL